MFDNVKLSEILKESISDYAANAELKSPSEWINDYLMRKLTNKSEEVIHSISQEVTDTIDSLKNINDSMKKSIEQGVSSENWLVNELANGNDDIGSIAKTMAESLNGLTYANADIHNLDKVDIIDINSNESEWSGDNWNEYTLKDEARQLALACGNISFDEIGCKDYVDNVDFGMNDNIESSTVFDMLIDKMQVGLKVAVSAGLIIAEEQGIIPPMAVKAVTAIAHKTIESLSVIKKVIKGEVSVTDALIHIKDTAVSTFCGVWKQCKNNIKNEIVDTVKNVFGKAGTIVSGIVTGLVTPAKEGAKLKNVITNVGRAAIGFVKEKIHTVFTNRIKELFHA